MNTIYRRGMSLILSAAFISGLTLALSAEEKVKPLKDKPLKKLNIPKAGLPRDLVYLKAIAPTIRMTTGIRHAMMIMVMTSGEHVIDDGGNDEQRMMSTIADERRL